MSSPPASTPGKRAAERIDFAGSPRPTLGVEWEFALVDKATGDLSNEAAAVIADVGESPHVHKELLRIAIFAVGAALLLNLLDSGVALNFVMMALYAA